MRAAGARGGRTSRRRRRSRLRPDAVHGSASSTWTASRVQRGGRVPRALALPADVRAVLPAAAAGWSTTSDLGRDRGRMRARPRRSVAVARRRPSWPRARSRAANAAEVDSRRDGRRRRVPRCARCPSHGAGLTRTPVFRYLIARDAHALHRAFLRMARDIVSCRSDLASALHSRRPARAGRSGSSRARAASRSEKGKKRLAQNLSGRIPPCTLRFGARAATGAWPTSTASCARVDVPEVRDRALGRFPAQIAVAEGRVHGCDP